MIEIVRLKEASEGAVADISKLLAQLRTNTDDESEHEATLDELEAITSDRNIALIVATEGGHIVGMATLYVLPKFGKRIGQVEDVVVDGSCRGQGVGERIMLKIIECARGQQIKTLHLTSRPERVAAHRLYEKLGFKKKETDAFHLAL